MDEIGRKLLKTATLPESGAKHTSPRRKAGFFIACYHEVINHSFMAKPPAGSSLLFGALADSGKIKQRKNGSYRMVLKGVDGVNWFTDRPYRSEGIWNTRKLIHGWGELFGKIQPNAQVTFTQTSGDQLLTFEMDKPVLADNGESMYFRMKPISARGKKIVSSTKNARLKEVSLFIDDATTTSDDDCQTRIGGYGNPGEIFLGARLPGVDMSKATFKGGSLQGAKLINANLQYTEFFDTIMLGTDLSNSNIYSAVFDGVNLTNASLSGAYGAAHTFVDVTWSNTICPDGTNSDTNANCGFY